jgi:hypothetical protein
MVLLVLSIAATLAAPAFARLGSERPPAAADALLGLLHDARTAAIDHNATVTLRIDPKTLVYEVDTSTAVGSGILANGRLELAFGETFETGLPRLQYVFKPTGAAFADTVRVHGALVSVDAWSGVARVDSI